MALPDRFEQAGIIVGSTYLLALPTSELSAALVGYSYQPIWLLGIVLVPGVVVGVLLAAGHLPISYSHVWAFSLAGWILTFVGWALLGLSVPPTNRALGVLIWIVALCLAGGLVWLGPISLVRKRLGHT